MTSNTHRIYSRRGNKPNSGGADNAAPGHKYKIGQQVVYLRRPRERASREIEKSLFGASFEVSRLLPSTGPEFQYRLKNVATGQERVASETEIILAE